MDLPGKRKRDESSRQESDMYNRKKEELFRKIPKVDTLLKEKEMQELCAAYDRSAVVEAIRQELDEMRCLVVQKPELFLPGITEISKHVAAKLKADAAWSVRRVFNATGIILHTNLGRAPLGRHQMKAVLETLGGYSNLEYDLETGMRGRRQEHYAEEIAKAVGAEGAIAVNNNAAAVTLILNVLTKGKEVIISRGELIEIGGRFRIPEVMEQSGAILRETGCTNRTRISDYEKAIGENTGALLKVHTSNYKIVGFIEEVSVDELAELGEKYHLPVIVDLGSGVLVNLEKYGLSHEPTVQEILKKGADLVCFSGDKLLGGPQAGIIAGKEAYIKAMENHPLMRTFRLDKYRVAALEVTFREYRDEACAVKNIPVLKMLTEPSDHVRTRAEYVCEKLRKAGGEEKIDVQESKAMMGGGAMPTEEIKSYAVTIMPTRESCEALAARMRKLPIPVIAYMKHDKVMLDMRTVPEEELHEFTEELKLLW